MIPMTMIGKVRRMFHRQNKSVREIARLTSLSRNTISKYLNMDVQEEPKYQRRAQPTRLTPFHEVLVQALSVDARRPKKERRTAWMLFQEIKAGGYDGCYSRVTDFIRAWRQGEGKAVSKSAFVPLRFELGEAFQFDWSEEGLVVGGIYRKLQVSHMKLCASRAFWLVAYPSQGHEMLFDAHTRSFAAFGGVARRGIYDNMKTAVDKVHKGKGRTVNPRFAVVCSHYLFDPDFCNVASGWEKGVVEKNVQDSRLRIWIEARAQRFGSFADLNAWLATRCRSLWDQVKHPDYRDLSVADVFEQERAHLMPMPTPFDGYVERAARVSSTCLVVIGRNRYPVPLTSTAQTAGAELSKGKRRPRASPTVDMGFCVFNGKRTCCVLGCEVTKNAKCFPFAVPVRDYRCCCVARHGNRGERHDRRCLVFHGISVHGMSLLVVARRAECEAQLPILGQICDVQKEQSLPY
ncbi:transposase [Paraburkholderia sp. WC7.3g]